MNTKRWKYHSEYVGGNVCEAVAWINQHHPEWDVIAMKECGLLLTVVVWREEIS